MGNLMIIDDSSVDRKIIRKIIERKLNSVTVYEAEDGFNIKEKLKSNNIHLCILDIMMPKKNGFQVLQELKDDGQLLDLPVIVCTGTKDKNAIEKALDLGAYDYFSKPLDEEAIKISLPLKVRNAIELIKRKQDIEFLSYHDKLTGLYNRRYWEEQLKILDARENRPLSLIIGDVNGLKLTNDAFGHDVGDKLLMKISGIIKDTCDKSNLVFRIGGDEFLIALPNSNLSEADKLVAKIQANCLMQKEDPIKPSLSFGTAIMEHDWQNISEVYKNAEDRMYNVKLKESKLVKSSIITSLSKMLDERSRKIKDHCNRTVSLAQLLGKELGLSEDQLQDLSLAALFHDIGIIGVSEDILNKSNGLSQGEWESVKSHCRIGYRIAGSSSELSRIAFDILSHHEHWNGKGYPQGIYGENIPLNARIISVIDTYDAMINGCFFQSCATKESTVRYLEQQAGKQFDPTIVEAFLKLASKL